MRPFKTRELGPTIALIVVTLCLYGIYWAADLGRDMNRILGREKYRFHVVLVLGIVTLGLAAVVFEILYAYDLQKHDRYREKPWSYPSLGGTVLALNLIAFVLAFVSGGLALVFSVALGTWATWKLQDVVNRFAAEEAAVKQLSVTTS